MAYFVGWLLFLIFFKIYLRFKVVGREYIPKSGAFIFASNHASYFDPILLGTSIHRNLYYMAREDLFKRPLFGWALRSVHAFPVKRGKGDLSALRQSLSILGDGKPLVIFPEGTRSKERLLRPAKPGVGFIVKKADVPVVPAYIEGSFDSLPGNLMTLRRGPVKIYIGEPIIFKTADGRSEREEYQAISDEIMKRIGILKDKHGIKAG